MPEQEHLFSHLFLFLPNRFKISFTAMNYNHRTNRSVLKIICVLFLGGFITILSAQHSNHADSLKEVLRKSDHDTSKIRTLAELAEHYRQTDTVEAIRHLEKMLMLAERNECAEGFALYYHELGKLHSYHGRYKSAIRLQEKAMRQFLLANNDISYCHAMVEQGNAHLYLAQYEKALQNYETALGIFEQLENRAGESRCLNNMGIIYKNFGEYNKALKSYMKVVELDSILGNIGSLHHTFINIGNVYLLMGQYQFSMDYFDKAFRVAKDAGNRRQMAKALVSKGVIQNKISNHTRALDYYEQALKISRSINDRIGESVGLTNIGTNYIEMEEYDKAKTYIEDGLDIKKQLGDTRSISNAYNYLAHINFEQGNYSRAENLNLKALGLKRDLNEPAGITQSLLGLGRTYIATGDYDQASKVVQEALSLSKEIGLLEQIVQSYLLKKNIAAETGRYKDAYRYAEFYKEYSDSLLNESKTKAIQEIEYGYRSRTLEQENEQLKLEGSLAEEKMKRQDAMFYAILSVSILLAVILILVFYYQSRQKQLNFQLKKKNLIITRQNTRLDELNRTKDRILSIIAHDLRGTIGNQITALAVLRDKELRPDSENSDKMLARLSHASSASLELLENLLLWSRMQEGEITYQPSRENLCEIIDETIMLFEPTLQNKHLTLEDKTEEELTCYADRFMIHTIFRNLLSNAIKYSHHGGQITIEAQRKEECLQIEVKDRGIGMSQGEITRTMRGATGNSRRGTDNEKGSGLGLTLVRDFLEYHGGEFRIESEEEKGTLVLITLPCLPDRQ